jgi:cysteine synthase A
VLSRPERGIAGAIEEARRMAAGNRLVFWPQQFDNPLSAAAHQRFTGPELIADVARPIDGFRRRCGTGGTFDGHWQGPALKLGKPPRLWRARPEQGICLAGEPEVCGGIPGVVDGLSTILDVASISTSEDILVPDPDAIAAARLLANGLPVGPSSGLNFAACVRLAGRLGPGHHIATVLCDRMERYFSSALFDDVRRAPLTHLLRRPRDS